MCMLLCTWSKPRSLFRAVLRIIYAWYEHAHCTMSVSICSKMSRSKWIKNVILNFLFFYKTRLRWYINRRGTSSHTFIFKVAEINVYKSLIHNGLPFTKLVHNYWQIFFGKKTAWKVFLFKIPVNCRLLLF